MLVGGVRYASLEDLEAPARAVLPPAVAGYYASGAERGASLADNAAALARVRLLPRALVDVSRVDASVRLFGRALAFPVLVAPMAMQRLADEAGGERAVAAAAAAAGVPMVVSTMATFDLEEVAAAAAAPGPAQRSRAGGGAGAGAGGGLWFQVYCLRDRAATAAMVRAAAAAGYRAIVLTVDAPRLGRRDADARAAFALPPRLRLANVARWLPPAAGAAPAAAGAGAPAPPRRRRWLGGGGGAAPGAAAAPPAADFAARFGDLIDASLTWEAVAWLKSLAPLPVLVKGILAPDDARRAVAAGAAGVIVSNHGGRQLDGAPAAADVLPLVAAAVGGRVPVLVDGGVRRGSDVAKCLALGADAVLVGRPILWALALGGEAGVAAALEQLRGETEAALALLGCPSARALTARGAEFALRPPLPFVVPRSRL